MPSFTWQSFGAELGKLGAELEAAEKRKITKAQAEIAQKIAAGAAGADIGGSFSGWRRGNPIELETKIRALSNNAHLLTPTRVSAGPWTVAERGRNQGNSGGFAGPGVNRRSGRTSRNANGAVRKVRAGRARRWNGTTQGKNTASDALGVMDRVLPKIADDGVRRVIRKHFDVT